MLLRVILLAAAILVAVDATSVGKELKALLAKSVSTASGKLKDLKSVEGIVPIQSFVLRSVHPDGKRRNLKAGQQDDYGDNVELEFHAFGEHFVVDLVRNFDTVAPEATFGIIGHDGETLEGQQRQVHYKGTTQDGGWARATILEHNKVHLVFFHNGEVHSIEPVIKPSDLEHFEREVGLNGHEMIAFKLLDREALSPQQAARLRMPKASRSCEASFATATAGGPLPVDPGCTHQMMRVKMWVGVDAGFTKALSDGYTGDKRGLAGIIAAKVAAIFEVTNLVYVEQLNVFLSVDHIEIRSTPADLASVDWSAFTLSAGTDKTQGKELWNNAPADMVSLHENGENNDRLAGCDFSRKIGGSQGGRVDKYTAGLMNYFYHKRGKWDEAALVHILTDCLNIGQSGGIVGVASLGAVCTSLGADGKPGVGWTTWVAGRTYQTVAHEVGHNFNMRHTWDVMGVGDNSQDGTIMSYAPDKVYKFSSAYSLPDACDHLYGAFDGRCTNTQAVMYEPICGNGIVEAGEECEGESDCCKGCRFPAGKFCCGGECCVNGKYALPGTLCESNRCGDLKFGIKGQCKNGACSSFAGSEFSSSGIDICSKASYWTSSPCKAHVGYPSGGVDGVENCVDGSMFTPPFYVDAGTVCSTDGKTCDGNGNCNGANGYSGPGGSEFGAALPVKGGGPVIFVDGEDHTGVVGGGGSGGGGGGGSGGGGGGGGGDKDGGKKAPAKKAPAKKAPAKKAPAKKAPAKKAPAKKAPAKKGGNK